MNNTIFDDVFRTLVEKMPRLVIPLINEVFGTAYPEDCTIVQLRNEHQGESGEVISDSCLQIGEKLYHIECQSTDDTTMAVRMIEYDFRVALEQAIKDGRRYRIRFPKSCVLYLRSNSNTPDFLEVEAVFSDEQVFCYRIPTVKISDYTKEEILRKDLLMLLPFYIMRYEKEAEELEKDSEKLQVLLREYEEIRFHLERELLQEGQSCLYADLIVLIMKIVDYIFRGRKEVRKGMGDIMGGKVLELESERLMNEGRQRGIAEGRQWGILAGKVLAYMDAGLQIETIMEKMKLSREEIEKILEEDRK